MANKPKTRGEIIAWVDNALVDIEQVMSKDIVSEAEIVITLNESGEVTITSSCQRKVDTIKPETLDAIFEEQANKGA